MTTPNQPEAGKCAGKCQQNEFAAWDFFFSFFHLFYQQVSVEGSRAPSTPPVQPGFPSVEALRHTRLKALERP
jgi:hypothetical protein